MIGVVVNEGGNNMNEKKERTWNQTDRKLEVTVQNDDRKKKFYSTYSCDSVVLFVVYRITVMRSARLEKQVVFWVALEL